MGAFFNPLITQTPIYSHINNPPLLPLPFLIESAMDMSSEQFEEVRARLRRILRRCGWTLSLMQKPYGCYVRAVKRDVVGKRHQIYMAPLYRIKDMDTAKIRAMLPDIV
jgi:hypothetical protein